MLTLIKRKISGEAIEVANNTAYQLVGKFISMCITVMVTVVVARYYGKSAYGEFSLMQNWPALFFVIVDFGLNAVAVRELSRHPEKYGKIFGNVLIFRTVLSLFFITVMGFIIMRFPYSSDLKTGIIFSLLLIYTQALYATGNIFFQIKMRYDLSTISYLTGYAVIFILILACVLLRLPVGFVSFCYVIGGLITFIISLKYLKSLGVVIDLTFDKDLLVKLTRESFPLGMMFIFSQVNFKSDSLLMSVLPVPERLGITNTEVVAIYSLPYKVFEVALVLPTFFMNSVYPIILENARTGSNVLRNKMKLIMILMLGAGTLIGLMLILLAPLIISILGGEEFKDSVLILRILSSGLMLYFLTQPLSWLLVTLDLQKGLPYIYAVSALFNITANYIFIPIYSYLASAVITNLSELIVLTFLIFSVIKAWKIRYAE